MPFATRALRRNVLSALVHASLLSAVTASPAIAATVTSAADSGPGSLREAVNAALSGDTIGFDCVALSCPATITLTSQGNNQGFPGPTALSIPGSKSLTIAAPNPGDITLQAQPGNTSATSLRLFYVDTGAALTLQNLDLKDGKAIGGNGGGSQASAYAGSGGGAAGLGGAIFSQGALTLAGVSFSGNSAAGGIGGGYSQSNPFGGGGGMGADGGVHDGGGGGTGGNGGSFYTFYSGPFLVKCGGHGGVGLGGAGGGSPGCYSPGLSLRSAGGTGSNGGGGGGAFLAAGGAGSDGGGGGASGATDGGAGGFGGGGGASSHTLITYHGYGGAGGFGGGGGGCTDGHGGAGGIGGGAGQSQYSNQGNLGGGGAGFGGAVFARGGTVTVQSPFFSGHLAGNTVSAGTGYQNGAAAGTGLFLISGVPTTFEVAGIYTIDDTIADDSPVGLPPGQSYTPGAGAGLVVEKTGPGILVLNGANTYGGLTAVLGGAIGGNGQIPSAFYVDGAGAMTPGDPAAHHGVGTLTTGPLNWAAGGAMDIQIGSNQAGSDLLVVNGALTKNGSGTWIVNFSVGDNPPKPGATYTLIQSTDASAFAAGDFSFFIDASFNNLTGTFSIDANAVTFTVGTVSSNLIFRSGFD